MWYKVANASEYLVITGVGIEDIKLAKKAWIMPGQTCTVFDMTPVNYAFQAEVAEADADLMKKKAGWTKEAHVAEVEASKAVALREAELQKEVERMNALTRKEKLTAELLTEANVEYETKVQSANSEFYKEQKATDAVLYQREKEAEAQKATAEAKLYARQQAADAKCYARKKEAEGLMALGHAQGAYLLSLLDPVGGNYAAIRDFMMIKSGMLQEVAKINAEAVRGIKPKISIWTNGCGEGGANGAMKEIAGVYKALPPLFNTVHELLEERAQRAQTERAQTAQQEHHSKVITDRTCSDSTARTSQQGKCKCMCAVRLQLSSSSPLFLSHDHLVNPFDSDEEHQTVQNPKKGNESKRQQEQEQSKGGTLVTVDGAKELELETLLKASAYMGILKKPDPN
ncbi:flotillin-like protein 4 [Pyrus communis]|uniref:flotillin-like protein 4 n=1 Tax=Pyrus communis TaxID=23211 RepID=UPI0035C0C5A6